jgi:hypothetical protein
MGRMEYKSIERESHCILWDGGVSEEIVSKYNRTLKEMIALIKQINCYEKNKLQKK